MPEEPPDSARYVFLSRQQLQQAAQVTAYALQRRIKGCSLNGEMQEVHRFCRDIKEKFEQTPTGIKLRDTRSINHIQSMTNEYNGRMISGYEFPQRVLEFVNGLENIEGMSSEDATRYEKAMSKFNQKVERKP